MFNKFILLLVLLLPSLCLGESVWIYLSYSKENSSVSILYKSNKVPTRIFKIPTPDGKISIKDSKEVQELITQFSLDFEMNLASSNIFKPEKNEIMTKRKDKRIYWTYFLMGIQHSFISHDFMITSVRKEPDILHNSIEMFAYKSDFKRVMRDEPDIKQARGYGSKDSQDK